MTYSSPRLTMLRVPLFPVDLRGVQTLGTLGGYRVLVR